MKHKYRKQLLWVCVLLFISSISLANNDELRFQQRPLTDIIEAYNTLGFSFLFSSDLVNKRLVFQQEPKGASPIQRLNRALREFNLQLKEGKNEAQWLIIKSEQHFQWFSGQIFDKTLKSPITFARINSGDTSGVSDQHGIFKILLPANTRHIEVTHEDYHTKEYTLGSNTSTHNIYLSSARLEEIIITASRYSINGNESASLYQVSSEELASLPILANDALRATTLLPGVSSNGLSAQTHIRGGLRDETLTLFNNVELLEPFHLKDFQSLFSGINPSLINAIDVYTGGFPARYGDKMSGVIDIQPISTIEQNGGELHMSFLSTGGALYNNIMETHGHWIISARRGNLDIVSEHVDSLTGDPSYSDAYSQVVFPLTPSTKVDLGVLAYNDNVVLNKLSPLPEDPTFLEGEYAQSRYRNTYTWAQLYTQLDNQRYFTGLSYGSIRHQRYGFINEEEEEQDFLDDRRAFKLFNLTHKLELDINSDLIIELGGKINYSTSEYRLDMFVEKDDLAEFIGEQEMVEHHIMRDFSGIYGGVFGSAKYKFNEHFSSEIGLRWDYQDFEQHRYQHQTSPRLSTLFSLSEQTQLRLSLGRFYQPEGINDLQVADGISDFQKVQYTDTYIVGFEHFFENLDTTVKIETFNKKIHNPKSRFENIFNALELVPELMDDRIAVSPEEARSKGIELSLGYEPTEQFKAWMSYARGQAEDRIDQQWRARIWEQDESLLLGTTWQPSNWMISSVIRWHSGWKTTQLPSQATDAFENIDYNNKNLPEFFSLDIKIQHNWHLRDSIFSTFLEVTNLTNRKNIGGVEYDFFEDEEEEFYTIIPEDEELLSIVPSLGIEWKFKN